MIKQYLFHAALAGGMLACTVAMAQETGHGHRDTAYFSDWVGVTKLLAAHGIDPDSVDWESIEPLCGDLQSPNSQIPYNHCKYDKALLEHRFGIDTESCRRHAEAFYPDSLLTQPPVRTYTVADPGGEPRTVQETGHAPSQDELDALRDTAYDTCMQSLQWLDSNDWRAGLNPVSATQTIPVQTAIPPVAR